ncbi:TIGR02270 family protein [Falsiroseomonas sp.]|uniref:TIGR02270 family protein n=1 Tax=Falsiroseomonas sp. TaxID=2870721 RepID=UPI0035624CA5
MPPLPEPPVLEHIVEQHAEGAAFLWTQRDAAVEAPHYSAQYLVRLDERLEAHLDGLRVAGEAGWRIAAAQREARSEAGESFAAAILALESRDMGRIEPLAALTAVPEARRGLVGAIAWCPPGLLAPSVQAWHASPHAAERYLAVCACSVHRAEPGPGYAAYTRDRDALLRARALRLAGELGRPEYRETCLQHLGDPDPEAHFWAGWSAVLLGDRGDALRALEAVALAEGPRRWQALEVAVRAMGMEHGARFVRAMSGDVAQRRATVVALGHLGAPSAVPWLIARMADADLARVAGEAFSMITGADLSYEDLEGEPLPGVLTGPNDDPTDEEVAPDPDEDLPWPDPARIGAWWADRQGGFRPDQRYLCGQLIDAENRARTRAEGYQPQRRAACLEAKLGGAAGPLPVWRGRSRARPR